MINALAADAVVLLHLAFIAFVIGGAALLWRWPRLVVLHVPAVLWGAYAEFAGMICPLTPLENRLRALAGDGGYRGGFVEHYLLPLIYPEALTREVQLVLGLFVVAVNVALYAAWLITRRRLHG
ncbi:DUF2784 domain-containing protein [Piscinibacter sp.]|uniref:DUF2784 domain-containing protein n=1 Tax=Piscinibacter sp. TaxID=1903157 RepID=UPI002CF29CF3|nr:DUF2784 domain-containing protein [Albitalea sp.]HUG24108.1 DUF2784 domain-containing protein [Albitalea sp.]